MGTEKTKQKSAIQSPGVSIRFERVNALNRMLQCWDTSREALVSDHYGLTSSKFLPHEYRRLVSHQYFQVIDHETNVATLRMIPEIDLRKYKHNLFPEVLALVVRGTQFIDLGLYYSDKADKTRRSGTVKEVVAFSVKYGRALGMQGLYIQVPVTHQRFYTRLGFKPAGDPFLPEGWNKQYVPMYRV